MQKLKVNDIEFKTKQEIYDYYKVKGYIINRRMKEHNITLEDAINMILSEKIIVHSKEFSNQAELCKHYEISQDAFQKQKKLGLSAEQIVDKLVAKKNKYIIKGKDYKTLTNVLKTFHISESLLNKRLKSGVTLEEAVLTPVEHGGIKVKTLYKGVEYDSITKAISIANNNSEIKITRSVVHNIMKENTNITFDEAVDIARERSKPKKLITYYHNGERISIGTVDFCKRFKIKYSDLSNLLKTNELDKAIIKLTKGFYFNVFGELVYNEKYS